MFLPNVKSLQLVAVFYPKIHSEPEKHSTAVRKLDYLLNWAEETVRKHLTLWLWWIPAWWLICLKETFLWLYPLWDCTLGLHISSLVSYSQKSLSLWHKSSEWCFRRVSKLKDLMSDTSVVSPSTSCCSSDSPDFKTFLSVLLKKVYSNFKCMNNFYIWIEQEEFAKSAEMEQMKMPMQAAGGMPGQPPDWGKMFKTEKGSVILCSAYLTWIYRKPWYS